ncbi:MAG: DUF47 family protein [Chloroflexota bacterium]|nr:DUF47 family protein [Chloroflexota bacterium]
MPKIPSLVPREPKFFDLFEKSVSNVACATRELSVLFEELDNISHRVCQITELEHQGDYITHQIMEELHCTFVTPLDREDIALLADRLDDMLDFIEDAANALQLYRIDIPTKYSQELANILVRMTDQLVEAMPLLRRRGQMKKILKMCVEINRLENEADHVVRLAMADLFDNMETRDLIKWREIYGHLEDAADKAEDVANVLEGVVLKHG